MDPRCDQSLGVVMYETATGRRPLGQPPLPRLTSILDHEPTPWTLAYAPGQPSSD